MQLRTNLIIRVSLAAAALALVGFGCSSQNPSVARRNFLPTAPTGPTQVSFASLSPADAAKAVVPGTASSIVLEQDFSGSGLPAAAAWQMGTSTERTILVTDFAPDNQASISWTAVSNVQVAATTTTNHVEGALAGIDLAHTHELELPSFWAPGNQSAFGASALWLSDDVYQNLVRNGVSSLDPGITDMKFVQHASTTSAIPAAMRKLLANVNAILSHNDVYVARATTSTASLILNGTSTTVATLDVTSWFGNMVVLANEQDPMVLSFTPSANVNAAGLDGWLGYQVTAVNDIER